MRTLFHLPLALTGFCLALLVGWSQISVSAADQLNSFKLLSNEAADRCISEETCLRDLFLKATLGGDDTVAPLHTTAKKSYIASFAGDHVSAELRAPIEAAMRKISLLATLAGADLDLAEPDSGEVISLMVLISDDFVRDREQSFKKLLTEVFAGNAAGYDDLAESGPPICRTRLFVDRLATIEGALALAEGDTDRPTLERCLHRLTLNMLGLRHPLPENVDSVLNPASSRETWTSIDFLLLKLLHDPLVEPGMTSEQLIAIFPKIYAKLELLRSSS
ncbi:MAG: DUF2927 domain-containing protein [Geminicoccaceae bacterium]